MADVDRSDVCLGHCPLGAGFGLRRLEFLAYDVENVEGQYGREKAPNGGERIIEKQIGGDHRNQHQHGKYLYLLGRADE